MGWGQLTGVCLLQDKWVLNHEDVLLGERIGRVRRGAMGSAGGQGCPDRVCRRTRVALCAVHGELSLVHLCLGRVTLGKCSADACVLTTPPWL